MRDLPEALREYHQFRDHLHTIDGIAIYKDRVVIPSSLSLSTLHSTHRRVSSMIARAEAPSQPSAPPTIPISPVYPFQCICSDFFHHKGVNYLVIVDRYSNWPIVERISGGATGLIDSLRRLFVTYGIPDEVSSDGGPEFTAVATHTFLVSIITSAQLRLPTATVAPSPATLDQMVSSTQMPSSVPCYCQTFRVP